MAKKKAKAAKPAARAATKKRVKPTKKRPAKTSAKRVTRAAARPAAKPTAKPKAKSTRLSWFDARTHAPLIEKYARQLDSFLQTMADGKVEASEIKAQEERLVGLMEDVEPKLNDTLHDKVTHLLCELTAYDLMQMLHTMQEARPQSAFVG
jgi:hypothetical protein